MTKKFPCVLCILSLVTTTALAAAPAEQEVRLPKPHYHETESDPAWLKTAVQIHGHLGPAIVFGIRVGAVGREAVQAQGYFDVEITAKGPFSKPPKSCILDGLQISTGATLGKRNLHVVESEEYRFTVKNKRTGKTVEIIPTPGVLELMWSRLEADDHEKNDAHAETRRVEAVARQIVGMPLEQIVTIIEP